MMAAPLIRAKRVVAVLVIDEALSTRYEVAAVIKQLAPTTQKALWFDNVSGYDVPIIGNVLGTKRRLAMSLGADGEPADVYFERRGKLLRPTVVEKAPVKEVVVRDDVDILRTIPVLLDLLRDMERTARMFLPQAENSNEIPLLFC